MGTNNVSDSFIDLIIFHYKTSSEVAELSLSKHLDGSLINQKKSNKTKNKYFNENDSKKKPYNHKTFVVRNSSLYDKKRYSGVYQSEISLIQDEKLKNELFLNYKKISSLVNKKFDQKF